MLQVINPFAMHTIDLCKIVRAIYNRFPKNQVFDGISMLPALTENKFDPEREVFTHYPVYHHEQPMSALRKGDWKIVENLVTGEFDLYNLKYDVNEMTDLKYSYSDKLDELKHVLKKWQNNTNSTRLEEDRTFQECLLHPISKRLHAIARNRHWFSWGGEGGSHMKEGAYSMVEKELRYRLNMT